MAWSALWTTAPSSPFLFQIGVCSKPMCKVQGMFTCHCIKLSLLIHERMNGSRNIASQIPVLEVLINVLHRMLLEMLRSGWWIVNGFMFFFILKMFLKENIIYGDFSVGILISQKEKMNHSTQIPQNKLIYFQWHQSFSKFFLFANVINNLRVAILNNTLSTPLSLTPPTAV